MAITITARAEAPIKSAANPNAARHAELDALLVTLAGTGSGWNDVSEHPEHSPRATSLGLHHRAKALGMVVDTIVDAKFVSVCVRSAPATVTAIAPKNASKSA